MRFRRPTPSLRSGHFLFDHPAWSHFAEEYGLRQLAIKAELSTTHAGP